MSRRRLGAALACVAIASCAAGPEPRPAIEVSTPRASGEPDTAALPAADAGASDDPCAESYADAYAECDQMKIDCDDEQDTSCDARLLRDAHEGCVVGAEALRRACVCTQPDAGVACDDEE